MLQLIFYMGCIYSMIVYMIGAAGDPSEGWKHPLKAIFVGFIGAALLVVLQHGLVMPAHGIYRGSATFSGMLLGNGSAIVWCIFSFAKFYQYGFAGVIMGVILIQVVSSFAFHSIAKMCTTM